MDAPKKQQIGFRPVCNFTFSATFLWTLRQSDLDFGIAWVSSYWVLGRHSCSTKVPFRVFPNQGAIPPHQETFLSNDLECSKNKLAKLGDAIAISNLKLSMTDSLTDPLTGMGRC